MVAITHQGKNPSNHYNHYNINVHIEEKCWKFHLELNPKNKNKDNEKKNLMATYSSNQVGSILDVDEVSSTFFLGVKCFYFSATHFHAILHSYSFQMRKKRINQSLYAKVMPLRN